MKDKVLATLLDLRTGIGELQAALTDIEKACRKLTAVIIEAEQQRSERNDPPQDDRQ